jgi:hypothetical protein
VPDQGTEIKHPFLSYSPNHPDNRDNTDSSVEMRHAAASLNELSAVRIANEMQGSSSGGCPFRSSYGLAKARRLCHRLSTQDSELRPVMPFAIEAKKRGFTILDPKIYVPFRLAYSENPPDMAIA